MCIVKYRTFNKDQDHVRPQLLKKITPFHSFMMLDANVSRNTDTVVYADTDADTHTIQMDICGETDRQTDRHQ